MSDSTSPSPGPLTADPSPAEEFGFVDRRRGPGQRVSDIEHELAATALSAVKTGAKHYVALASVAAAIGSAATFLLMIFGLKIGGAADLSALRADVLRKDSAAARDALRRDTVIDRWRGHTDSVTTSNALRISHLEDARQFDHFILCNVAEQVGARTGGMCQDTAAPRKP